MDDVVLNDNEVRGLRVSSTPLARLEERMNGEAEARSMLHGEIIQLTREVTEHIEDIHAQLTTLHAQDRLMAERTVNLLTAMLTQPSRLARVRAYIGGIYRGLPKKPLS